jgi:hypothetical protein
MQHRGPRLAQTLSRKRRSKRQDADSGSGRAQALSDADDLTNRRSLPGGYEI